MIWGREHHRKNGPSHAHTHTSYVHYTTYSPMHMYIHPYIHLRPHRTLPQTHLHASIPQTTTHKPIQQYTHTPIHLHAADDHLLFGQPTHLSRGHTVLVLRLG